MAVIVWEGLRLNKAWKSPWLNTTAVHSRHNDRERPAKAVHTNPDKASDNKSTAVSGDEPPAMTCENAAMPVEAKAAAQPRTRRTPRPVIISASISVQPERVAVTSIRRPFYFYPASKE